LPRVIRVALVSVRDLMLTFGPFVLIAIALLVAAYAVLDPTPPKRVVLATGPENTAYAKWGELYAAELRRYGIRWSCGRASARCRTAACCAIRRRNVDVAFVQGGSNDGNQAAQRQEEGRMEELVSLGTIAYDPVWIFYRSESAKKLNREAVLNGVPQMRGWRVNVGCARQRHAGNHQPDPRRQLGGARRAQAREPRRDLRRGGVARRQSRRGGARVRAGSRRWCRCCCKTPGIRLYEYHQAESYARRYPFLSPVILPRAVVDIARDVPAEVRDAHRDDDVAPRPRGDPPGAGAAFRPGRLAHPQRPGMDRARRDLSELAPERIPARQGRRALLPERASAPAALSAVLGSPT
jgi:hypothetical protein